MGLKRWTGSAYADVTPANVRTMFGDNVPKAAYVWDGAAFVKVWPLGVVHVEEFDVTGDGWWNGFSTSTGSNVNARNSNGLAGLKLIGMNASANTFQMFASPVTQDDQYLQVKINTPLNGTLDTGASGAPLYVRVRCNSPLWAVGTGVEVMIRASGVITIASFNGATVVNRASTSGSGRFSSADELRVEAQGNTYRVLNVTRGTTLATWTDTGNVVDRAGRYAGMTQVANYPFFQQMYSCYSVSRWEFGDL